MKKIQLTDNDLERQLTGIAVTLHDTPDDVGGALDDVENFISVKTETELLYVGWEAVIFDFTTPDTSTLGQTTLLAYLDLRKLELSELVEETEFEYRDRDGLIQDKIPFCIQVQVEEPEY